MNAIVFGSSGLLGSAVQKEFSAVGTTSKDFDATDQAATRAWFKANQDLIANSWAFVCCGRVAGIGGQKDLSMYVDNALMAINLLTCLAEYQKQGKTVYYSSSCVYPASMNNFREQDMFQAPFEVSNEGYALGKASGQKLCEYLNASKGTTQFITVIPPNLYGDNDNWNTETCHVLPAITQKIRTAQLENKHSLELWGVPTTRREFLRSTDVATASRCYLEQELAVSAINTGMGTDISIGELAEGICSRLNYHPEIVWTGHNTGKQQKLLCVDAQTELGFTPAYNYDDMMDYAVAELLRRESQ